MGDSYKVGAMLPTKWEIVPQLFGQDGSHALPAEQCQRGQGAQFKGNVGPDFVQCSQFWCNQILGENLQIAFRAVLLQNISD